MDGVEVELFRWSAAGIRSKLRASLDLREYCKLFQLLGRYDAN